MMRLSMGLPEKNDEISILERYMETDPLENLASTLTPEELKEAREAANKVFVHKCVLTYIVDIVNATREPEQTVMGVSPRGSLALLRCTKAYAYLDGRDFVTPDDVKTLAIPVLAHRVVLGYGAGGKDGTVKLIQQILDTTPVPTEDFKA